MPTNYRVPRSRGANVIDAAPQRLESTDGSRWATGRNVKRNLPGHRYDAVEVWTLKERDSRGRACIRARHCDRRQAEEWVAGGPAGTPFASRAAACRIEDAARALRDIVKRDARNAGYTGDTLDDITQLSRNAAAVATAMRQEFDR